MEGDGTAWARQWFTFRGRFVLTPVEIPDGVRVLSLDEADLPKNWTRAEPLAATQNLGERGFARAGTAY
jgi:hypothetical protein